MEKIFEIPGKPVAKQRPRMGKFGTYTPKETVNYESFVKMQYLSKYSLDDKFTGEPIKIEIWAYFEPTTTERKSKKKAQRLMGTPYKKKPDADNIAKTICDALNGIAYEDDNSIATLTVHKLYAEQARVEVKIMEW